MTAYKRILLPTNFTELAAHAAGTARALAEEYGATLYVLHVGQWTWPAGAVPANGEGIVVMLPDEDELRRKLAEFVHTTLDGIRVPVTTDVRIGSPVRVIAEYAREMAIDLIVFGTNAHGVIPRIFAGSVSEAVLERVGCAVLMVPKTAVTPGEPRLNPDELVAAGRDSGAM